MIVNPGDLINTFDGSSVMKKYLHGVTKCSRITYHAKLQVWYLLATKKTYALSNSWSSLLDGLHE